MYFQIVFVLNDPDLCSNILDAWEGAGIRGITFLESSGLGRVRQAGLREDLPLIPSMNNLLKSAETHHRTLFAVVKDQNKVDAIVEATQSIVGDLELEGTGFLFVIPVSQVYGESKLG
jgi:nitrogen regulatory protein PII